MFGRMSVVKPAKQSLGRRQDVLGVLKAADSPISIATIADVLDVHPNTVRFHLDTLLAEILASGLAGDQDAEARATAAGREWGRKLKPPPPSTTGPPDAEESVAHLVGLLDELGFAPERRGDDQIELRHCPFLELAESHRAVVCPTHLGLMRGALETWQAPLTADRLDAFVEPDLCLVHLARRVATA